MHSRGLCVRRLHHQAARCLAILALLFASSASRAVIAEESWRWTDTLSIFGGLEGSKQPQDVGVNANFGGRGAVNFGFPIWEEAGLGVQVGTSFTLTDNAVRVLEALNISKDRFQNHSTVGVFQRIDNFTGFTWAIAWDHLYEDYYADISLHQFRGRAGLSVTECDEIGTWGTISADEHRVSVGGTTVNLSPVDQINIFWRHLWRSGVETEVWGGVANGHGEVVHVLPGNPSINTAPLFGASLHVPLNDHLAIMGQGNFILPADTGTVDSYLGFVWYFDKPSHVRYSRFAPVLDVAASTSFPVDLSR
ncbi:MAG: hypothetical protein KDA52_06010 [Planctomycetaceae bacterium]|nr:hypothetical protein [Planctomycetaceae bacterium]